MTIYERIGSNYDDYRNAIGAQDVLSVLQEMGDPLRLRVLDLGCGTGHPIAVHDEASSAIHSQRLWIILLIRCR
jgi:SAM-dependent methyltransferase